LEHSRLSNMQRGRKGRKTDSRKKTSGKTKTPSRTLTPVQYQGGIIPHSAVPVESDQLGFLYVRISDLPGYQDVDRALLFDLGRIEVYDEKRDRIVSVDWNSTDGYGQVWLRRGKGGSRRTHLHQLSATTFCGREAGPQEECRHLDGDRTNNRLGNVVFGTKAQNGQDRRKHGKGQRKLTEAEARLIAAKSLAIPESLAERRGKTTSGGIAREFGISTKLRWLLTPTCE
jgi:hypothetical protein